MEPHDRPDPAPAEPAAPQEPAAPAPGDAPQPVWAPPPVHDPPAPPMYVPPWARTPQPGPAPLTAFPAQPGTPPPGYVPPGYAPPGVAPAYVPPGAPSWALPAAPIQAGPAPGVLYAGFGVRFVAYVIDWVILGFVSGIIWFGALVVGISAIGADRFTTLNTVSSSITADQMAAALTFAQYVYGGLAVAWLVTALYFIVLWHTGGTLGMRALGLRVAREEDGRPIGYGRATARYLGYLVDWIALGIGMLWVGIDSRKQGWHDKIAGTLVVKRA